MPRAARLAADPPAVASEIDAAAWMQSQGWQPHAFQRQVWAAMGQGTSGLLHATTGSGKTYAVWLGALHRAVSMLLPAAHAGGPQVLWLTPMRALASDTVRALERPLPFMAPAWRVGQRTGDTPSAERARQERRWPQALVTTPESLTLLLTREDAATLLRGVHTLIVDEWHELVGSKRGVQVQLALARLASWCPKLVVWGLSATLGNLDEALRVLTAPVVDEGVGERDDLAPPLLVQGRLDKTLRIDTLLPAEPGRFSWGGHLGAQMLKPVVAEIETSGTTLVFTNTRSQAEIWYQLLLGERPDWAGLVALHHGSLDHATRDWVEQSLKAGTLKAVVATSSLDLGVDFLPVERVLQIGSAKGVARLLQRAGRSGHAPGRPSRITLVPTNTLELVEAVAARHAAQAGRVEPRRSPEAPLDVLVQHLVTVALGGGFEADALFEEVRRTVAYMDLPRSHFDWALDFVEGGGRSLTAYPEYHRVKRVEGRFRVTDRGIAQRHRLQVGTIVADATMQVKWASAGASGGASLGSVEEGFIARLSPGDCFVFAGRVLEYVRTRDLIAYVRKATKPVGAVPTWAGSKMPLSTEMADAVQAVLADWCAHGAGEEPELAAAEPMLQAQARLSRVPVPGRLLLETWRSREGFHAYLYPFAGRLVHTGLAQLLAWRLDALGRAQGEPGTTFSLSVNDHGLELVCPVAAPLERLSRAATEPNLAAALWAHADEAALVHDVMASLNAGQLAQRRFREIARVSGLVFNGYPGAPKAMKQLQASSRLFFEVFQKYDADNQLLHQAEREVLSQELDLKRLRHTLATLAAQPMEAVELAAPSPFALPLMVERLREQLSTEKLADRIQRLLQSSEQALAAPERSRGRTRRPRAPRHNSPP